MPVDQVTTNDPVGTSRSQGVAAVGVANSDARPSAPVAGPVTPAVAPEADGARGARGPEVSASALRNAVEQLNSSSILRDRNLGFEVDEELGKTLISVIDLESEEKVRQIPPEEFVEVARKLLEVQQALLGDDNSPPQGSVINVEV